MTSDVYDIHERKAARDLEKARTMVLPPEFWDARMDLAIIRDAARRRQVAPDAVLGACLSRVTAIADWQLRIPATIGFPNPISCWGVLTGSSSASKSAAMRIATALIPDGEPWFRTLNVSTGEALITSFFEDQTNPETNKIEAAQIYHAAFIGFDEGSLLQQLQDRKGSTLTQFMLTAWNGGDLGTETLATSKKGQSRVLKVGTYNMSILIALQPEVAEKFLDNAALGLVQRFIWYSTNDPDPLRPRPKDHSIRRLGWAMPRITGRDERHNDEGGIDIDYPERIKDQIWEDGADGQLPGASVDPLNGHLNLAKLRLAVGLALISGRIDITEEDWALASMIADVSGRIRADVIEGAAARLVARDEAHIQKGAAVVLLADNAKREQFILTAEDQILHLLSKRDPAPWGVFSRGLSDKQKSEFPTIMRRLVEDRRVVEQVIRNRTYWGLP